MKFVQIGREVVPRLLSQRKNNKAVITSIKNGLFVIIMKQDRSKEIVSLKDVVLTDKVYTREELENPNNSFYNVIKDSEDAATTDFDRFIVNLRKDVINKLVEEKMSASD